jgi:AcrR family transcriptional regulator
MKPPDSRNQAQLPTGRHGLPRSFVIQNQRERILAAVADVTSAASYAEMTVEDIIVTAGVSRRTFYEHFKNKEDAFLAAYNEATERLLATLRWAYESHDTFVERVRVAIELFLCLLSADPAFARMCIVEVLAAGPEAARRRAMTLDAFAQMLSDNAGSMLDDQPLSPLTAETVVGGLHDVIYTRILRGDVRTLPTLAPDLVYSALLPYVGAKEAKAVRKSMAEGDSLARVLAPELWDVATQRPAQATQ